MKHLLFILAVAITTLASCSRKEAQPAKAEVDTIPMMVMQIKKCSKLHTAEYKLHKIITHKDTKTLTGSFMSKSFSIDLPLGSRKVAIPIDATAKAYIDFSEFSEKNIHKNGDKIEIILPDPKIELTSTKVNHNDIKQHVPLMRSDFTDEELAAYERQGRDDIVKSLSQTNFLETARLSATRTIVPILEQLGYKEENITVSFRKPFSLNDIKQLIDKTTLEHGDETNP